MDLFKGRRLVIATMHGKEQVIAPILEEALGVEVVVPDISNFNTDMFGTFSGEIERTLDPVETARQKCIAACKAMNETLAVASEGSFGPHPALMFIPADEELILLRDTLNDIEIGTHITSTNTNFGGEEVHSWEALKTFATNAGFPKHGLILRDAKDSKKHICKGISSWSELENKFRDILSFKSSAFAETDMRAHLNPTRMKIIALATEKLVEKVKACCPSCGTPGFDDMDVKEGLPCSLCKLPTKSIRSLVYKCKKCNHSSEKLYPKGKTEEDPMFCDNCNP